MGRRFWPYMYRLFASMPLIFTRAVAPTATATAATTRTAAAILTATGRSANPRDRRGAAGDGEGYVTWEPSWGVETSAAGAGDIAIVRTPVIEIRLRSSAVSN